MKRLLLLTSLSLIAVLGLASSAFAQDSFCTTSVAADGGDNVATCVDAPSPIPSATASPDVTVISGGPLAASATATAIAGGTTMSSVAAAVGGILPPTGGEGFALIAAALLLGSGVLSYAILRRSG